ncbi:helix-turn-helix transcriptional regulator [Nonomuraea sp. MTCD27]|uniref:helix-turn-helix transcriptional regulator n=1 Tax=Nonomuraea sp. MTCD27 TaxID=1676747 RepID=UPI0035BFA5EF
MTAPLRQRFRALRETQGRDQNEIAAAIGVAQPSISNWENGHRTPRTHHAAAWATALNHRLIVTRNGQLIGDLQDVLPKLGSLRRTLGYSRNDVTRRLHLACLSNIESRAAGGGRLQLPTIDRYLAAIGCRIDLHPSEVNPC